jgi:hypothetical protein
MENQNQNINQNPNPSNIIPQMEERASKPSSVGPFVGIIIVILVIVLGGLYFWGQRLDKSSNEPVIPEDTMTGSPAEDDSIEMLETQGLSDEISDIEGDLNTTNLDNLDQGLQQIESELNQSGL